ncbi:CCA tRNA nucleotidyltransferase [Devosia sp.]|uniref:CCA tRNA nucleotidyltransferase n=1 Tax=Devosia sp. TaxID=1871048 RepID=UPI003265B758
MIAVAMLRLQQAEWLARPEVQDIFRLLDGETGRTRAVGGIVRDTVLERVTPESDVDMATELLPAEVMARAVAAGIAAYPTGIDHGTVTLRHGAVRVEVTTLRKDIETDGRHAVVQFGSDWVADARRRDFTLNALYANMDGELFDPVDGIADCRAGHVRFIGDPAKRIAEDGLRVYRFFRFSASHGQQKFDAAGLAACGEAAGRLAHLSPERVGAEMVRMLSLPRIAATLAQLEDIGLVDFGLDAQRLLLAYERQAGVPSLEGRLALLHKRCPPVQGKWRLSNDVIARALALYDAAKLLVALSLNEAAYRFAAILPEALDVAGVEAGWGEAGKAAVLEKLSFIEPKPLPVSGNDLIARGFAPGPALGLALRGLERQWVESGFTLGPQQLLDLLDD